MTKPPSETHKELWKCGNTKRQYHSGLLYSITCTPEDLQSTTVDIADHEKLKHAFEEVNAVLDRQAQEIERLKAECEGIRLLYTDQKELNYREWERGYNDGFDDGLKAGERRAMERVKGSIARWERGEVIGLPLLRFLEKELGLSEPKEESQLTKQNHIPCELGCYTHPAVQCGCKCHKEEKR